MQPYYQDDAVTIYHGDCREIVPTLGRFDLLLTDPPYGIQFVSHHRAVKYDKIAGDDAFPVDAILSFVKQVDRAAYVFCRWDNLWQLPKPRSVLVWVKNNWSMGDLKHAHGRQWEACCFYPQSGHKFIERIPDVITSARTGNVLHPTEKPVELMKTIIAANFGEKSSTRSPGVAQLVEPRRTWGARPC